MTQYVDTYDDRPAHFAAASKSPLSISSQTHTAIPATTTCTLYTQGSTCTKLPWISALPLRPYIIRPSPRPPPPSTKEQQRQQQRQNMQHCHRLRNPSHALLLVIGTVLLIVSDRFGSGHSVSSGLFSLPKGVSAFSSLPPPDKALTSTRARHPSFPITTTTSPSLLSRHAATTTTSSSSSSSSSTDRIPPSLDLPLAPGPRPLPLFGNMVRLIRLGGPDRYDAQMQKRYGKMAR